jgi:Family of unknown function (DUF6159)
MGRFARGWQMTKQSWAVVRADRSLLVFPVVAAGAGIATSIVFFGAGAGIVAASKDDWLAVPFVVAGLYVLVAIGIFCSVALSACASRALEGHDTTIAEGLGAARSRLDVILAWAGVQLVVGALISALQALLRQGAGAVVGALVGGLANLAWTVATFFVVPGIALEGLGPRAALTRSTHVIRERWGEGVSGTAAIGAIVFFAGILPGGLLIAIGVGVSSGSAALAVVLIVLGAVIIGVAALLQTTIMAVFKVALFRFATEDRVLGEFERAQLETAFRRRRRGP